MTTELSDFEMAAVIEAGITPAPASDRMIWNCIYSMSGGIMPVMCLMRSGR
jgi:hypothetical protein